MPCDPQSPPPAPEELELRLPASTVAARAWGPEHGERVLAVHGWQDNAASFDRLAPLLGALRVVAIDLPGHGRSEHLSVGASYTFLDWAVAVRDCAVALGWRRYSILGHSLGAGLANVVAACWPECVTRLALIDGFAPRTQPADEAPQRLREFVDRRDTLAGAKLRVYPDLDAAARRLATIPNGPSLAAARVLAERGTRALPEGGFVWRRDPRIPVGPPMRLSFEQMRAFLGRIRCPTLLVRPDAGWPVPAGTWERLSDALPQIELARIEGGHHVHLDAPGVVARHVGPFLSGRV